MTGVIVCGGRIEDYSRMKSYFENAGLVISADSGARHCRKFQVVPDLLVGDFDSVSEADYAEMAALGVEIARFPAEKDMTDSELAVDTAVKRGCKRIILLGVLGERQDHSLSNLFLLKMLLDRGVEGIVADEHNEIRLIDKSIVLEREEGVYITLLPLAGNAEGVSTQGLYYPLDNATLEIGSSRGVSNQFSAEKARVDVRKGYLLVMKTRD